MGLSQNYQETDTSANLYALQIGEPRYKATEHVPQTLKGRIQRRNQF